MLSIISETSSRMILLGENAEWHISKKDCTLSMMSYGIDRTPKFVMRSYSVERLLQCIGWNKGLFRR